MTVNFVRSLWLVLLGLTFLPSQMYAQASPSGIFIIIDPYAGTSCNQPNSPSYLTTGCGGTVYSLLQNRTISGVYLSINWSDYAVDTYGGNPPAVLNAFIAGTLSQVAITGKPLSITVGLQAGLTTPCEVYKHTGGFTDALGPALVIEPANTTSGFQCDVLPKIWGGGFNPYIDAFNGLMKTINADLAPPGGTLIGVVTGLKISGGINDNSNELHVTGTSMSTAATIPGTICQASDGSTHTYTCITKSGLNQPLSGAQELLAQSYSPPAVETTFDSLVVNYQNYVTANPGVRLELDALDANVFPAIISSSQPAMGKPGNINFNCSGSTCVIDPAQGAYTVDGMYFTEDLILDLPTAVPGINMANVSVQTDGLKASNTIYMVNGVNVPQSQNPPSDATTPCWSHINAGTLVGWQSGLIVDGTDNDQSGNNWYEDSLTLGVTYGASYLEVWPKHLSEYLTEYQGPDPEHGANFIASIQSDTLHPNAMSPCFK